MRDIDFYIKRVSEEKIYGGDHRTKAYPFEKEGVILLNKFESDYVKKRILIKKCRDLGINISAYIDYKFDGQNYWLLEELASGNELEVLVREGNITKIFGEMPYEHLEKYIKDVYLLGVNGIGVEPRRRNIFYDGVKGFTIIDVGLLPEISSKSSLKDVNYFFNMYHPPLLVPFSNDEYGFAVREKTILNIMRAFENGHPFFNKVKRWIYRGNPLFAKFLEKSGCNLTLTDAEYEELINLINELIDSIVNSALENPMNLSNNRNYSYINFLESSIVYCPKFDLYDLVEQDLHKYVKMAVAEKIKSLFFDQSDNSNLRNLYFQIRRRELDPVRIYQTEYINEQIEEELSSILDKKNR